MTKSKIIADVYLWVLVVAFMAVLCAQFYVDHSFLDSIETSNYFALLFSAIGFSVCALPLAFRGKICVGWGDVAVVGFFFYIVANSYFNDSLSSTEFRMSVAYFSLYFALKLIVGKYPRFVKFAVIAILITGIYQSILVLRQLYGFDYSNHHRFAVTGSFYNPGPCGIFIAAVSVLAVATIKNCSTKRSVTYVVAYVTVIVTLLALFPTMSRAGWVGAAVAITLLYSKTIMGYFKSKTLKISLGCIAVLFIAGVYVIKKDSADGRLFMWRNAIVAFTESPLTGVGIGNFAENYSNAQYQYFYSENVLTDENKNVDVVGVPTSVFNELISLALLLGFVGVLFVGVIYCRKIDFSPMFYTALSLAVASLFSYSFYITIIGIVFICAMACIREKRQFSISCYLFLPLLLLPLLNCNVYNDMKARIEWKSASMFYSTQLYDMVCEDYPTLLPSFSRNHKFLFEYGHSLNKMKRYKESNELLSQGVRYSTDPMFWTIIGNNYLELGDYSKSENAYLRAYYLCPNRLYPLYLLAKMGDKQGDKSKLEYYGKILINKKPKIKSSAVTEMKDEIRNLLNN